MSTLIRGCTIIAMDDSHGSTPFTGDILIEGDRIADIGALEDATADTVIDGSNRLAMPGLVNGHLHSGEALFKGRYDNLPLELWMLYAYPSFGAEPLTERLIYLRTMLVAIESLKTGVTCVSDDVFEFPGHRMGQLSAVFDAYADSGLRATVSSNIMDKKMLDTIPFTREVVPQRLQDEVDAVETPSIDGYQSFCKQVFERHHGREGRLRYMIAPSAPQRCTSDMLLACDEMARAQGVPFHTHIVETKVQGVTGPEFYGKTLMQYLQDLGVLGPNVAIAHSIWVTDHDIELMGDAGVSIIHNAISNQKLGAGIAPLRKLLNGGVNVALGSDGICSNDTPRMFDVMRAAALMHKVATPNYDHWPVAEEILAAATISGAKSAMIGDEVGSLEVGKKADIVLLDTGTINFTPMNDIRNHLVYCENGSSVRTVIVNGEVMVEDGRLTRIDEAELLAELRDMMPAFKTYHEKVEAKNSVLEPYFADIHKRCNLMDIGVHRLGAEPAWAN